MIKLWLLYDGYIIVINDYRKLFGNYTTQMIMIKEPLDNS